MRIKIMMQESNYILVYSRPRNLIKKQPKLIHYGMAFCENRNTLTVQKTVFYQAPEFNRLNNYYFPDFECIPNINEFFNLEI